MSIIATIFNIPHESRGEYEGSTIMDNARQLHIGKILSGLRYLAGIVLFPLLILSCKYDSSVRSALRYAGENRHQLELVLEHYADDPEKLEAAKFLIRNMPAHYSYQGDGILQYYKLAAGIIASDSLTREQQRDSLLHISERDMPYLNFNTVSDIEVITSDFLIHNIDQAFYQWKYRSWGRHLNFDEFCEWILPYKVTELQELDYWRDSLQIHFSDDVNSMIPDDDEYNTCFKTVDFVRNEIRRKVNPYGMYTQAGYPLLSAELLPKQTFGRCADYVNLGVLTYRSLGLPAIIDEAPFWGRYRAGHTWYTILGDRGQELPAEWDLGSVPGWQFFPYERIPKVWRQTFAYNEDVLDYRMHSKFKFPFPLCRKDVSDHYMRPIDVEIPIRNDPKTGKSTKLVEPYAYIAIFNGHGEDWSIFDFGKIKKKKVIFHNIGRNILYIALGYNGRSLVPISEPFILEQNGNIRYIHCDSNHLRSIDVHRKYYQSTNVVNMRRRIIGAKIQYADTPDFSDAVYCAYNRYYINSR